MSDSAGNAFSRTSSPASIAGMRRKPRGFPEIYADFSPLGKLSWLTGEECGQLVREHLIQRSQVQAELRRLRKLARQVALLVPSPCRLEEFWGGQAFPPPAEHTPMRQATKVLDDSEKPVFWPAHYLSSEGATYDVVVYETEQRRAAVDLKPGFAEPDDESASAAAIHAAAARGAIVDTGIKLPTEDERVLKDQIQRYLAGKKTTLLDPE